MYASVTNKSSIKTLHLIIVAGILIWPIKWIIMKKFQFTKEKNSFECTHLISRNFSSAFRNPHYSNAIKCLILHFQLRFLALFLPGGIIGISSRENMGVREKCKATKRVGGSAGGQIWRKIFIPFGYQQRILGHEWRTFHTIPWDGQNVMINGFA